MANKRPQIADSSISTQRFTEASHNSLTVPTFFTRYFLQSWLLTLLAFALYANSIPNEYAMDDKIVILENKYTQQGLAGIPKIMTTDALEGAMGDVSKVLPGGRYRPLSIVTFAVEYQIFGKNPQVSHGINALLYALLVFLIYQLCQNFLFVKQHYISWFTTFIFAIHPIHTETVANIKGRDEIMSLIFLILSLQFYLTYLNSINLEKTKPTMKLLYISFTFFFLALLSKENGLTFVAIFPVTIYTFTNKNISQSIKSAFPFIAIIGIYFVLRFLILGFPKGQVDIDVMNNPYIGRTFEEKYATIIVILGKYLQLLFFPYPLSFDYSYQQIPYSSFTKINFIVSLLINVYLLIISVKFWLKKSKLGWAIMFYFLSIFLVSNIPINLGAFLGERLLFQPSLGFAVAIAIFISFIIERTPKLAQIAVLNLIVFAMLIPTSYITLKRNAIWFNNETLFTNDILISPNSALTNKAYGEVLIEKSRRLSKTDTSKTLLLFQAIKYLEKSQEIHPRFVDAIIDCATAYYDLGNYEKAENYYLKAKEINPNHSVVVLYANYLSEGFYIKGAETLNKANGEENQFIIAEKYFRKSLVYNANNKKTLTALELIQPKSVKKEKPFESIEKDPAVLSARSMELYKLGQYGQAEKYAKQAVAIDPNNVEYLYRLGGIYMKLAQYKDAVAVFEKAYAINPNHADGRLKVGLETAKNAKTYFNQ